VNHATFIGNSSTDGGAIWSENNTSTAALSHDLFVNNNAQYGGAIYNNDNNMTIGWSTFRFNSATGEDAEGGAIYNDYIVTISGSAFMLNKASYEGGAIYNDDATVTLNRSQLTVNRATDGGGGIYNYDAGTVTLSANLILANVPDNCEPIGTISGCFN
jgi:predicted outer membrane repeat protein